MSRHTLVLGSLGPPAPPRLRSPPSALERLDLVTRASKFHCRPSLPLPATDTEAMWLTKPSTPVSALLLLALALSPPGTQGRPQRSLAARVAELRPELFLPVTGTRLPPRASRSTEIFPRDLTLKDKFIKHFTGPVTFSAECSKHFHRLYHNTRDCSTPAYYKRCARLLTRLAVSPLCSQT